MNTHNEEPPAGHPAANAYHEATVIPPNALANPLVPARLGQGMGAAANTDQARAIAEVQSMLVIAQQFPRNEINARDKILMACARKGLAAKSTYIYNKGGTDVVGPSIRLAETMANHWRNIVSGWRELSREGDMSDIEAFAFDTESNVRWAISFKVKHWRDGKKGTEGKKLTQERDIYEICANMASRRIRACILKIIPPDIIDDALEQCKATLEKSVDVRPEHIKRLVDAFMAYGITKEMIEDRLQRHLTSIAPQQVIQLGNIFTSLEDGMSQPSDWFDMTKAAKNVADPAVDQRPQSKNQGDVKGTEAGQQIPSIAKPAATHGQIADVAQQMANATAKTAQDDARERFDVTNSPPLKRQATPAKKSFDFK